MMETEQVHREYFNDPQLYSLAMNTRDEVIVLLSGHAGIDGRFRLAVGQAVPDQHPALYAHPP